MKKRGVKFIIFSVLLFGGIYILNDLVVNKVFFKPDDGIKKVFSRNAIERKADALAESGRLDEALALYQEAIKPQYINQRHEKSTAIGAMQDIYVWKGDYDKALEMINWFVDVPGREPTLVALEKKREIEALQNYQKTGDPAMILQHIQDIHVNYKAQLPPAGYGINSETPISVLIRLYNTIGEHNLPIKLIDDCLEYFKQQDIKKYGEHRPGDGTAAYLKVREALERDKAEGFKGCAGKKPGEVCMGYATKALIESDYFPW